MWELQQDLFCRTSSVTLQESGGIFDSLIFFPSAVDWLQVSICCIRYHHSEEEKTCCFCLCTSALCIVEGHALGLFISGWAACNSVSIPLLPEPPLALNNTSGRAVRDHLTLKLLDFTLKAPATQMSVEFCRLFLLIRAQTLPEGRWGGEANVAWVTVHVSIQLLSFTVLGAQIKDEGT